MTLDQLIEQLKELQSKGLGSARVEVCNPAGDTQWVDEIRVFEGTIYIES